MFLVLIKRALGSCDFCGTFRLLLRKPTLRLLLRKPTLLIFVSHDVFGRKSKYLLAAEHLNETVFGLRDEPMAHGIPFDGFNFQSRSQCTMATRRTAKECVLRRASRIVWGCFNAVDECIHRNIT